MPDSRNSLRKSKDFALGTIKEKRKLSPTKPHKIYSPPLKRRVTPNKDINVIDKLEISEKAPLSPNSKKKSTLSIDTLKELIDDLMYKKEAYDWKSMEMKGPIDTMEQFFFTYLQETQKTNQ